LISPDELATERISALNPNVCAIIFPISMGIGACIVGRRNHSTWQTPHKKPRGKELSPQQKAQNKEFSSTRRIFVEHTIRLVRIFRIAFIAISSPS